MGVDVATLVFKVSEPITIEIIILHDWPIRTIDVDYTRDFHIG